MRNLKILSFAISLSVLFGCTKEALINQTHEVANGEWEHVDVKSFFIDISDTLTPFNYYALIRHGGNYKYQNLIIYFKTYFPNNQFVIDTIDCPMATPEGKWHGKGLGDLLDNEVMFKRNIQFPIAGAYKFEIQHAMRPNIVDEIYDVGLLMRSAYD